ncbi:hypothetical protein [Deinococcus sp. 12RED42]|uniref:hypothetical protein n=1 Tax=Deinococcus sp. 12RED42 TaxID=2745872 RepID=UPI001E4D4454|nr:hypothetical protein [Deinococcus sp. 12RED42]MCD0164726.1 hypothetical protein [Deinococcus sp. 12RED42]
MTKSASPMYLPSTAAPVTVSDQWRDEQVAYCIGTASFSMVQPGCDDDSSMRVGLTTGEHSGIAKVKVNREEITRHQRFHCRPGQLTTPP